MWDAGVVSHLVVVLLLLLTYTQTHTPPYLNDCSLVHWETGRWCHSCVNIAMATPLFPLPTMPHTQWSHSPTPTNLKTHAGIHTESPGLHPVQDKLNPHAPPAIFEKSIHVLSLFQITLGEVRQQQLCFLFLNQNVATHKVPAPSDERNIGAVNAAHDLLSAVLSH